MQVQPMCQSLSLMLQISIGSPTVAISRVFTALVAVAMLLSAAPGRAQSAQTITTLAGNGSVGYSGDGHAATLAALSSPNGVAVDIAGNTYIADTSNYVIRKVSPDGTITTVAGTGTPASSGDGGPATSAQLILPRAIAVDYLGNLFIADGDAIREVTASTGIISKLTAHAPAGGGCTGACTPPPTLRGGVGLAIDTGGNLYIADAADNVVLVMDVKVAGGGAVGLVAGNGSAGYSGDGGDPRNAQLNSPEGVAVSTNGVLYIADTGNCVIRELDRNVYSGIGTIAGNGTCGYSGDNGLPYKAQLNHPHGLAVDSTTGTVYVADTYNSVIRKVVYGGQITTVAGNGTPGPSGDGGPATSAQLNNPYGVALDAAGSVYIADNFNQRIRKVGAGVGTAMPVFSPAPGTYPAAQAVSITDATAGAAIYYTIDGTVPTTASSVYSGPITVSSTATIEAIAVAGSSPSTIATGTYTIGAPLITTVAGNGAGGYSGDGGAAISAQFKTPSSLAFDNSGNMYVADTFNSVIRMITPGGIISTVAGTGIAGYSGDGAAATSAQLNHPYGLAVDIYGNIYIADNYNSVVRKVTTSGIITTVAGTGTQGFSGDGGPASGARLFAPWGVAADMAGDLFISDANEYRIRKVTPDGIIRTIAGNGTRGYSGDGGPATSAQLDNPEGLAVDAAGNLYIADFSNDVIRKVVTNGTISTIAGGPGGYSGDGGPATSAQLSNPISLAFDAAGNLYIADSNNFVTREITPAGIISTVAGNGTRGYFGDGGPATSAQLNYAYGVGVDASGNLYIADSANNVIRRVGSAAGTVAAATPTFDLPSGAYSTLQTVTITDATVGATIYYTTDGTVPTVASTVYSSPIPVYATQTINAIAVAAGYLNSAVATANYTWLTTPVITWPNPVPIASGTALDATQLNAISDTAGTLVYTPAAGTVLDAGYHTLSVTFTPADPTQSTSLTRTVSLQVTQGAPVPSPIIATVAGIKGIYGYSGDGGPAIQAQLNQIGPTATDAAGNLYIGDRGSLRIRKVAPDGTITTVAGSGVAGYSGDEGPAKSATMQAPNGLAVDSAGNLYIVDTYNNVVRRVSPDGNIHTFAGNHTSGNSGDGGPATSAQLSYPFSVATDSSGNVYISDTFASVVRKVALDGTISTVAGTGNALYWGDGGLAIDAGLNGPEGLAVDLSGNLYIAEYLDNVIRKVDKNGIITTVAGTNSNAGKTNYAGVGVAGYYGDGGPATSALLYNCRDLVTDASGNLYISDGYNYVVRKVTLDGSVNNGIITTIAGNGVSGYSGDGGPATGAQISYPGGIALDPSGNLYIADLNNNVIRKVGASTVQPMAAPPSFSPAGGAYTSLQTVSIVTNISVGATIYYTTDGSTPTTSSIMYTAPIPVAATETVNAIAVASGYSQSTVASARYTISLPKLAQTIKFSLPPEVTYGSPPRTLYATASSGLPVSFSITGPGTISGSTLTITGIGEITIIATQAGNNDYLPANDVTQQLTVHSSVLTVTANDKTIAYPAPLPAFDYAIAGFVNGDTPSLLQGSPVLSTAAGPNPVGGKYPISVAQGTLTASNYSFQFVPGTLTVSDYMVTADTASTITIPRGQSVTIHFTVAPVNGYKGTITFSCGTLPADVTCAFDPAALTADGTNTDLHGTLTINTVMRAALAPPPVKGMNASTIAFAGLFFPGSLAALFLGFQRRRSFRSMSMVSVMAAVLCLCGLIELAACGAPRTRLAQPGTSTVVVNAASSADGASHQLNLTITIQ